MLPKLKQWSLTFVSKQIKSCVIYNNGLKPTGGELLPQQIYAKTTLKGFNPLLTAQTVYLSRLSNK